MKDTNKERLNRYLQNTLVDVSSCFLYLYIEIAASDIAGKGMKWVAV